jgi:hypothetical protein
MCLIVEIYVIPTQRNPLNMSTVMGNWRNALVPNVRHSDRYPHFRSPRAII